MIYFWQYVSGQACECSVNELISDPLVQENFIGDTMFCVHFTVFIVYLLLISDLIILTCKISLDSAWKQATCMLMDMFISRHTYFKNYKNNQIKLFLKKSSQTYVPSTGK